MRIVFLVMFMFSSFQMLAQSKKELMETIKLKIEQEKILDADVLCDKLIEKYAFDDSIAMIKASIIDQKDDRAGALAFLFSANNELPESFQLLLYTASMCMNSSLFDTSKVFCDRALKHASNQVDSFDVMINIAAYYNYTNKTDTSNQILKNLIAIDSSCVGCYSNLAMNYNGLKEFKTSVYWMKMALKYDSTSSYINNNIGLALSEIGEYYEAIEYYNKSILLDPKFAFPYSNLGYAYYKIGDHQKAIKSINKSIELNNHNSWAYRNLALVHISQKSWKQVCIDLNRSAELGFNQFYGSEVDELLAQYCKDK